MTAHSNSRAFNAAPLYVSGSAVAAAVVSTTTFVSPSISMIRNFVRCRGVCISMANVRNLRHSHVWSTVFVFGFVIVLFWFDRSVFGVWDPSALSSVGR